MQVQGIAEVGDGTLNRTMQELKFFYPVNWFFPLKPLNHTMQELKYAFPKASSTLMCTLNRTMQELKFLTADRSEVYSLTPLIAPCRN